MFWNKIDYFKRKTFCKEKTLQNIWNKISQIDY